MGIAITLSQTSLCASRACSARQKVAIGRPLKRIPEAPDCPIVLTIVTLHLALKLRVSGMEIKATFNRINARITVLAYVWVCVSNSVQGSLVGSFRCQYCTTCRVRVVQHLKKAS
jgi:hypothetical protein